MSEAKVLVVYFSRSGTTRRLASALARTLGADLQEICDCRHRDGAAGYLRSLADAIRKRPSAIVPAGLSASAYDLIVIGSPVWASSMSAPVRSYLIDNRARLPQVAFFCSYGGHGAGNALREMRELAGKAPVAECSVTAAQARRDTPGALADFVGALNRHLARARELAWI